MTDLPTQNETKSTGYHNRVHNSATIVAALEAGQLPQREHRSDCYENGLFMLVPENIPSDMNQKLLK